LAAFGAVFPATTAFRLAREVSAVCQVSSRFARSVRSLKRQFMLAIGNSVRVGVGAHPVERPAQDPRDLHLADPNVLGVLCLRELVLEAQDDHASFARGEDRGEVVERGLLLDALESGLHAKVDALATPPHWRCHEVTAFLSDKHIEPDAPRHLSHGWSGAPRAGRTMSLR
jgi:hypothetical protein